ncbi:hypothetical protein [uncultured Tenacibaculum sp.]|uniref:hypothetical protein n=1 Tax=uncultured Tenacibaculum sp. TaxID=174713 RepID=UPI00260C6819|nr:hypothetical protein [uncultured Tenacibaculum sp.]
MKAILIITTLLVLSLSCKAQQLQEPNLDTKILGTWIHNDDSNIKLVINSNDITTLSITSERGKLHLYTKQ